MPACRRWFAVRTVRFKSRLTDGTLTLERYRQRDLLRLHQCFGSEVFLSANRRPQPPPSHVPAFWLWLHRAFQWFYTLAAGSGDGRRVVGFIAFYDLVDSHGVTLAMAIFDPADRRRGYGRRALSLLLDDLERRCVVDAVRVSVALENRAAEAFFRRLGFVPRTVDSDRQELCRRFRNSR